MMMVVIIMMKRDVAPLRNRIYISCGSLAKKNTHTQERKGGLPNGHCSPLGISLETQ